MSVRLVMSGAVVGQELAAEFGPLPPSMLPVSVQKLYELQMAALAGAGTVHLVLPEPHAVSPHDRARLAELFVEIVPIPEGLRLGEAVVYALNSIGAGDGPVHILHGDTLISDPPLDVADLIVGGQASNEYAWAEMEVDAGGRVLSLVNTAAGEDGHEGWPVATGYFAFASSLDLLRSLTRMRGDFNGKSVFAHAVESFRAQFESHPFLFIVMAEAIEFVREEARGLGVADARIVALTAPTSGQAETVERGLGEADDNTPLTIFNIDTIRPGFTFPGAWHQGLDGWLEVFEGDGANWSYVRPALGEVPLALETAEKQPISNLCCTGLYHFARAGDFRDALARERAAPQARSSTSPRSTTTSSRPGRASAIPGFPATR